MAGLMAAARQATPCRSITPLAVPSGDPSRVARRVAASDAVIFAFVVMVAGGVREEIQRIKSKNL